MPRAGSSWSGGTSSRMSGEGLEPEIDLWHFDKHHHLSCVPVYMVPAYVVLKPMNPNPRICLDNGTEGNERHECDDGGSIVLSTIHKNSSPSSLSPSFFFLSSKWANGGCCVCQDRPFRFWTSLSLFLFRCKREGRRSVLMNCLR